MFIVFIVNLLLVDQRARASFSFSFIFSFAFSFGEYPDHPEELPFGTGAPCDPLK